MTDITKRKIAIAADHGGFSLKNFLKNSVQSIDWIDLGAHDTERSDFPDYAFKMVETLRAGKAEAGILICGTGIGMAIAANRYPDMRAALCLHQTMARLSREHNNANILVLGARVMGEELSLDCVNTFLTTPYLGGRYQIRNDKLSNPPEIKGDCA
jgi:ribose 5-phosphate isomerase B